MTRLVFRSTFVVCLFFVVSALIAGPAAAQNRLSINTSILDAPGGTVPAGVDFRYRVSYSCDLISIPNCENAVVTVDLPPEVTFGSGFFPPGDVASVAHDGSPTGGVVTFTFQPAVPAGNTGDLDVTVRFPNGSTPDGTSTGGDPGSASSSGDSPLVTQTTGLPEVTATATPQPETGVALQGGFIDDCPEGSTYEITFGPSTDPGSLDFTDVDEVVIELPVGVTNVTPQSGGVFDAIANTVTWTALGPISVGSTVTLAVDLTFADPPFSDGQTVTSFVSAVVDPLGEPPNLSVGPDSFDHTLRTFTESPDAAVGKAFGAGRPANLPPAEGQSFVYNVSIRNTGNIDLDSLVVTDDGDGAGADIDAGLTIDGVGTGAYGAGYTGLVTVSYTTNLAPAAVLGASPGNVDAFFPIPALGAGERVTRIEWSFAGPIPAGMGPTASARVGATVNAGFPAGTTIDNHVTADWTATITGICGDPPGPASGSASANRPFDVAGGYTYLRPTKGQSGGPYFPGDTVAFSLGITNDALANDPASGVVVTDLLPEFLTFQSASETFADNGTGVGLGIFEVIDNYNGTGRTLLRWTLTGDLDPGETVDLGFDAAVELGVIFGSLTNTVGMTYPAGPVAQRCAGGSQVDAADLDGDGDDGDDLCTASTGIPIAAVAQLSSGKFVRGQCDPGFTGGLTTGTSLPGGVVDWRVEVQNVQTVPMQDFVLIDILPFVGDTGVRDTTPRLSLFRPVLSEPVAPPPGGSVFYSLSGNPCRPEVGGPTTGCDAPNWTPIPPTPITDAQSIKVEFGDRVLNPLDRLEFGWREVLPADAPVDGSEAFNSFAFGSIRSDDGGFLGAEPNKVGIDATCVPAPPDDAMLGNFVWIDSDGDGIQDPAEVGLNNVPVQLFDPGPDGLPRTGDDIPVLSSITQDDDLGNPGWYKFSALAPGDYYVLFTPPPNFKVTQQGAGGDGALDSDTDPASACTDVVTLAPSENNPDIDMGLLPPVDASLGNYVWFDRDGDGVQNEALSDGVNGVAVKLFADDGDGNPEPGGDDGTPLQVTVTADDAFGNPGFYRFEELTPGVPYFVQFMLPSPATGFTSRNAGGDDTVDSDAASGNGTTQVVTLAAGEDNPTLDAGLVLLSGDLSLGNLVWCDEDGNGVIDAAGDDDGLYDPLVPEAGINGVRVNLYLDLSGDGLPQVNEFYTSTQTQTLAGKDGRYRFDGLAAGDYIVEVDASNFASGGALEGKVSSTGNTPTPDPDDDADNDDNGDPLGTTAVSQPVTLSAGGEPTPDADDDLEADADINFTVDFGFIPGAGAQLDFGDAPDAGSGTGQGNYRTVAFDGGAQHNLTGPMGPWLGACVDSDTGSAQSFAANADDLAGPLASTFGVCASPGDDEDGVAFSSTLLMLGTTVDITLTSSSAAPCTVNAWIDWNRDGEFDDNPATERVLTDVAAGVFPAIPVPTDAVPGRTYARFRCSTAGGDGPTGPSADGEVEDYLLDVAGADFGDAPDLYGTLLGSGGAVHDTDPTVELYLGNCVDTEPDGQPDVFAAADDTNLGTSRIGDCIDDEDGVVFGSMLVRGQNASVTVTSSMAARLDAWIDLDGVGGFAGADQIVVNQPLVAGANVFNFFVPANAAVGRTYARFRLSTAGGLGPVGPAADGEVEDYAVIIKGFDFGDLPEPTYPTLLASGGAQHVVDPGSTVYLGPPFNGCADVENDGAPGVAATGDDLTGTLNTSADAGVCDSPDDEDGVEFDTMLITCQTAQVTVTAAGPGRLDAWIDFDRSNSNGLGAAGDAVFSNRPLSAGANVLTFPVPCTAELGDTYARFRFSSTGGLSPGGLAMDGEVEDYAVFVKGADLGDAPDSYATSVASGGPSHGVDPSNPFHLGACVDTETDGQPFVATGDDSGAGTSTVGTCAVTGDDEDGVTFDSMLVACGTADVTVTASGAGVLDAWLDFDGDGAFGAGEQIFTGEALAGGAEAKTFAVPCDAQPGDTYARFRLTTGGVASSGGPAMDGEVEDYGVSVKGVDFGDAPDSYTTLVGSVGPYHGVDPALGLFLGSCVDTEADGQVVSGNAGDDDANAGSSVVGTCSGTDDEDGVVFDSLITACKSASITVTASAAGLLDAWIDFGVDGSFAQATDQIYASQALVAGPNVLTFAVPCDAADGTTFARFRFSSAGGLGIGGPAMDGEVEDYEVRSDEADYGDAPDTYGTTFASGGPLHGLDPGTGLFLGACVDAEIDGQPSVGATGDDVAVGTTTLGTCSGGDDEDGVTFDTMVVGCQQLDLTVVASAVGLLDAWIDFDGDDTFVGPSDQIFAAEPLSAGSNSLSVQVPCDVVPRDVTYARFRVSTVGGLAPGGTTPNGEVEDYAVQLKGSDLGDAPDSYATLFASGGPSHSVDPVNGPRLGVCVDTDVNGQPSVGADGDDTAVGTSVAGTCVGDDDEDGVVFDTLINVCQQADLTVTVTAPTMLDAWMDLDGDGTFNGPADRIFIAAPLLTGANPLSFTVPCDAVPGDTYARFRISSVGGIAFVGAALDGEVEDYAVLVRGFDYGDAPDPTYPTLLASDGARHIVQVTDNPTLGSEVDIEPEGLQSPDHLGDDQDGVDDEDGVAFGQSLLIPGTDTTVEITGGATGGNVSAWLDWNRDGDWNDPGERIATDLALAAGATEVLTLPVPVGAVAGPSCARFRIATETGLAPTGRADDGEVEDYTVTLGVEEPTIGLAKTLLSVERLDKNEWQVHFLMEVDNPGNVPLTNVQILANLADAFGDAEGFSVDFLQSDDLTVNPAFDGETDINLLAGSDGLAVGEMGSVRLQIILMPGANAGPYFCSATATGQSPGGEIVEDDSQDGGDSDPDDDGDPTNNGDPTVVTIDIPPVDIPTVGEVGLVLLAMLLALVGSRRLRPQPASLRRPRRGGPAGDGLG